MAATRERVLITGAGGFLGACLTHDLVAAGNDVHLLLRPTSDPWRLAGVLDCCNVHRADLLDEAALYRIVATCRPEVVYHLAGYGVAPGERDRPTLLATNVYGLGNLLSALACHDYRALVCAGTCWEYGQSDRPITEAETLRPWTDYGVAKAAASLMALAEAARGRPVTVVRIFSTYGPWEGPARLVPYVLDCCRRGVAPQLSHGTQVRDFIHADDVVALLRAAAACPVARGNVLHAGTGLPHSVRDLVEMVLAACGSRVRPVYGARPVRPDEPAVCVADNTNTTALTGWRPRFDLRAGIERTWSWSQTETGRRAA